MKIVTRKSEIKEYLDLCLNTYHSKGVSACVKMVENQILNKKVKFPLLEYCGHTFFQSIAKNDQIDFCDKIETLKTEGGNVLLGIVLQDRLHHHFEQSIEKATEYISKADVWYVCDIIGERVYGFSLLHEPNKTIPKIKELAHHPTNWVIRALGAGVHYAIKKGLNKEEVNIIFPILLSMANTKNKEIRQGVGWAVKTTAKFHPDLIEKFHTEIHNEKTVAN
ncbi:MAG: DNA alkylation repair protein [Saprospiraceae bacterium]